MEIRSYGGQAQTGPAEMFDQYRLDFPQDFTEQPGSLAFKDRKAREIEWIKKTPFPVLRQGLRRS